MSERPAFRAQLRPPCGRRTDFALPALSAGACPGEGHAGSSDEGPGHAEPRPAPPAAARRSRPGRGGPAARRWCRGLHDVEGHGPLRAHVARHRRRALRQHAVARGHARLHW